jgi:hypothetical protein
LSIDNCRIDSNHDCADIVTDSTACHHGTNLVANLAATRQRRLTAAGGGQHQEEKQAGPAQIEHCNE